MNVQMTGSEIVVRAIGLISGGLDSVLAARLLMEQGVEVLPLCFVSAFFGAAKAEAAARTLGLTLRTVDFTDPHMDMVKNPLSGHGKNMNPCIDCHAMMLRYAGEIMEKEGYDFLFTGEVLGQRPMSQNYKALNRVANLSMYKGRILRPLSAKLLKITPMEEDGLVNRELLESIQGRSRKPQFELAQRFGFKDYDPPGGGCLLTDPGYSDKLKNLFTSMPEATSFETNLLRMGRVFFPQRGTFAVCGRNYDGNVRISHVARKGDFLLSVVPPLPGATILLTGSVTDEAIDKAASIAVRYSKASEQGTTQVLVTDGEGAEIRRIEASYPSDDELHTFRSSS